MPPFFIGDFHCEHAVMRHYVSSCSLLLCLLVIALVLCLIDLEVHYAVGSGNLHRIISICYISVALLFIGVESVWSSKGCWYAKGVSWFQLFFLLLCLIALLVSVRSEFVLQSLQDAGLLSGVMVLAWLLKRRMANVASSNFEKLCILFLVPGFLYSIRLVLLYIEMVDYAGFSLNFAKLPNFPNFRYFNNFQAIMLPLFVYFAVSDVLAKSRLLRSTAYFVSVVWVLALVYTGARSVILSFVISACLVLFLYPQYVLKYKKNIVILFFASLVAYLVFLVLVPAMLLEQIGVHALRFGAGGREKLWAFSLEWLGACVWGCGGQHFVVLTSRYFIEPYGSPHNTFLSLFIEYGIISVIIFVGILIGMAKDICRSVSTDFDMVVFFSLTSFFVDSLFSGAIYSPLVAMTIPFWFAYLLSRGSGAKRELDRSQEMSTLAGRCLNVAVLSFGVSFFVIAAWALMLDIEYYGTEIFEYVMGYPRVWQHGGFFL